MNLAEFSTKAAEQFLQTAVFVDDKIYDEHREHVKAISHNTPAKARGAARKSVRKPPPAPLVPPKEPAKGLRCQAIVESFAKKRIVCSLYQMDRSSGAGPQSNLYKLVVSADILVIDWDIEGDKGKKASQLVASLVKSSLENEPEQLRSIIVYTAEPNLKATVADKLYEKICAEVTDEFVIELKKEDKGLAFHTKNSRITIFGKPIASGRSPDFDDNQVCETDLADRAIKEFSKLASGLLQGAALHGMALIRKNTRKIITMFGSELDGPFLLHRALSLPQEEACSHLIPLLVSEMEAVLEDQIEISFANEELLDDWCNTYAKSGVFARDKFPQEEDRAAAAKILIKSGPQIKKFLASKNAPARGVPVKDLNEGALSIWDLKTGEQANNVGSFILADEDAEQAQANLAILMSQRTFYSVNRSLALGSIINDGKDYYLCIQPACDCVRLKGWIPFPLLKLSIAEKRFHILVVDDKKIIRLESDFKPSSITFVYFMADSKSGSVEAKLTNSSFQFHGRSSPKDPECEFRLIGQLKSEQALRCVAKITAQLGRVGLTESVWARAMAK